MRKFQGQELISTVLNLGHVFFTGVINILYGQHETAIQIWAFDTDRILAMRRPGDCCISV